MAVHTGAERLFQLPSTDVSHTEVKAEMGFFSSDILGEGWFTMFLKVTGNISCIT